MTSPFTFDSSETERAGAGELLNLGIGQASIASTTAANRAAADQLIASHLAPGSPNNVNAPGPSPAPNYVQPDYRVPAPHPPGTVSQANPLGM